MKVVSRFVFPFVAVIVILFAIGNRGNTSISFWPLPFGIEMPLYVALLGTLAVGILLGAVAASFSTGKWWFRARASARKSESLEKRLATETETPSRSAPPSEGRPAGRQVVSRPAIDGQ